MRNCAMVLFLFVLYTTSQALGDAPVLVATDADGAAARVSAPVSINLDLVEIFDATVEPRHLQLVELTDRNGESRRAVPVQFIPECEGSRKGRLWWLMPPGCKGERRFRLVAAEQPAVSAMEVRLDRQRQAVDVTEGRLPVLCYNHGTVPPPPEIVEHFQKNSKPPLYYARGDYIHPVYGPDGEQLTDDYSMNHPHHRGVSWAWPVVRWNGEVRDLWAVRVLPTQPGGIWSRPVSLGRVVAGGVLAVIEAENVWKWGDREPIVREEVAIHVFRQQGRRRFIDVAIYLTALVDDVSIGGRPGGSYGGFSFRTFPQFDSRKIKMHIEPADSNPRRAWFHLTGNFPGSKGPAGVAMLEHVANPDYPSHPQPHLPNLPPGKYPPWRSMQPAWPGDREVHLPKGKRMVLKYRLWIHPGTSDESALADVWASYAAPPKVRIDK